MAKIINSIEAFNRWVGLAVGWLVLAMVLLQFLIVLVRHVFGVNSVQAQEIVTFMHGFVFMLAAAWVLQSNKHVRVDIFYANAPPRKKALVNMFGAILLLMPVVVVTGYFAFPYVIESWRIFEGSPDTGNMRIIFLQKTAILAFAALLAFQGLAQGLRAFAILRHDRA